mmetsp:Transcript_21250/g.45403  ORF Transcript_21250/g.45403 Transcript_21250/m.45403 type:complete len:205 (+) Transcript_21250:345-959(+)
MVRLRNIRILQRHHRAGLLPPLQHRSSQFNTLLHRLRRGLCDEAPGGGHHRSHWGQVRSEAGVGLQSLLHGRAHRGHGIPPHLRAGGGMEHGVAGDMSHAPGIQRGGTAAEQHSLHVGDQAQGALGVLRLLCQYGCQCRRNIRKPRGRSHTPDPDRRRAPRMGLACGVHQWDSGPPRGDIPARIRKGAQSQRGGVRRRQRPRRG